MFDALPTTADEFKDWGWAEIKPYFDDLAERPLSAVTLAAWMRDWTRLEDLIEESYWRHYIAISADTTDEAANRGYETFIGETQPKIQAAQQVLKQKLIGSGLEPAGFTIPLRNMRSEAELFHEDNLPLLAEEKKLAAEYGKIVGSQSVTWDGEEVTLAQLDPVALEQDRTRRQQAWEMAAARRLGDRQPLNDLWGRLLALHRKLAVNSGLPDYRAYRWRQLYRFDYTPEDCESFHAAIEEVVVPVASRIYAERKAKLGVDRLHPWDLAVESSGKPPLRPFDDVSVLIERVGAMFRRLDPGLADYYDVMQREGLLDLANRPNKAPSAWCTSLAAARKSYIFMNAVGLHEDVMTLLHEAGHGFHWCEAYQQPYYQQRGLELLPIEFVEVASTTMEYLNAQFLPESNGGFYTEEDAARARIEHLQGAILFWPYMAVVDSFQHWAYTHPEDAADPANCDGMWAELYTRYIPDVDWNGLEDVLATGWQRKVHIFDVPFYYIEYGLAQLGAIQIWRNSLEDQGKALSQYRHALSLGITVPLPELFSAAGAKFAFDAGTLRDAVSLMQKTVRELETA